MGKRISKGVVGDECDKAETQKTTDEQQRDTSCPGDTHFQKRLYLNVENVFEFLGSTVEGALPVEEAYPCR